jgi:tellurite resistance protein
MELSDSMATKDQAIDAKDLDGLMEGVWAKGALGGFDDSQRLLDFYFFENH